MIIINIAVDLFNACSHFAPHGSIYLYYNLGTSDGEIITTSDNPTTKSRKLLILNNIIKIFVPCCIVIDLIISKTFKSSSVDAYRANSLSIFTIIRYLMRLFTLDQTLKQIYHGSV